MEPPGAVPWRQWGGDLDPAAVEQMRRAVALPVAVRGALMPDAHLGYGLPIGGVLATEGAVIPYAVGVDIACRMRLSVLDMPPDTLDRHRDLLRRALRENTRFGVGAAFSGNEFREHPVMDEDWSVSPVTREGWGKALAQLGTSGSGNHFVDFGILELESPGIGLGPGRYLALLSHSGSRGTGSDVAGYYSRLAMQRHPELPEAARRLAWLNTDEDAGREYWAAMELMGRYAAANHALVHEGILRTCGAEAMASVENHHNFAWKERHEGRDWIVHRKGATPATEGVLGIIPGSMAAPAFVVRGRGHPESLDSAAHGAGRSMSRRQARKRFTRQDLEAALARAGVELLAAGLDEAPMAYKNIHTVMRAQSELVEIMARFDPRLVLMAGGETDASGRRSASSPGRAQG